MTQSYRSHTTCRSRSEVCMLHRLIHCSAPSRVAAQPCMHAQASVSDSSSLRHVCHGRRGRRPWKRLPAPCREAASTGTPRAAQRSCARGAAAAPVRGPGRFGPDEAGTRRPGTATAPGGMLHPRLPGTAQHAPCITTGQSPHTTKHGPARLTRCSSSGGTRARCSTCGHDRSPS